MRKGFFSGINQSVESIFMAIYLTFVGDKLMDELNSHWLSVIMEEDDMDIPDINVSIQEDKIYWINDNQLMVANIVDGEVDQDSALPFEADENASTDDLMWMFDMLDGLKAGEEIFNEDSPTWNQGV